MKETEQSHKETEGQKSRPQREESSVARAMAVGLWRRARWLPLLSFLIPLLVSAYAVFVATGARRDSRAVQGLDLRPKIELQTYFGSHPTLPRHYAVENVGPLDAIQLEVQLLTHFYNVETNLLITQFGGENRHRIPRLRPFDNSRVRFSDRWLDQHARSMKPVQHNVMEIRISYRHPADRRLFQESAFYFVNPEGRWVSENSGSITDDEVYETLRGAIFSRLGKLATSGDKLHAVSDGEAE